MQSIKKLLEWFNGRKTYFVAAAMIVYAILGYALGQLGEAEAGLTVFNALGIIGLRHGVTKSGKQQ